MPAPNPNALSSTFQVGTYSSLTDTFTSVFDLNDGVTTTIMWNTLRMPQPEKAFVRSFNLRAPGERITRFQYKSRHIQVSVSLRGATVQTILNTVHSLIAAIENPPYRLRISQPNATQYTYATVVAVTHNIPADPQTLLAKALTNVQIDFECQPSLLGDRVTLSNLVVNPGFESPSGPNVQVFNDPFTNLNAYTLISGSAPTNPGNGMTIPANTVVGFGSLAWGAINIWQVRFNWVTGLAANFMLHRTDASNFLYVNINGSALTSNQTVAAVNHQLATVAATLTNTAWYWLQITQFPAVSGNTPYVQATIFNDSAGTLGTQVATIGPTATFDTVTALIGKPAIQTGGVAMTIGGAFSGVHVLSLFGPGGWTFSNFGTGPASGAWEQNTANTYPNGPVTSYGAARIDAIPTGGWNGQWASGNAANATTVKQTACPVSAAGNVLGISAWLKSSASVAASCNQCLLVSEYDSTGAFLRQSGQIGTLTGAQAAWTQISTNYTTGANCAYVIVICVALDATSASANGTVWFDNVQVYNQTTTGQTSMPYCELRFPQSPAQLMVSGLVGDMPSPAFVAAGGFTSLWNLSSTISLLLARRASAHAATQLVTYPLLSGVGSYTPVLDSGSYGGYYYRSPTGQSSAISNIAGNQQAPSAWVGAYHLLERVQTSQAGGNLGNVSSNLSVYEGYGTGQFNATNYTNAAIASQFGASATWTIVDHGSLFAPLTVAGALTDSSQQYENARASWADTTGGGSQFSFGVAWLLPIDADSLGVLLINPAGSFGTPGNAYIWTYSDALAQVTGSSTGFAWGFSSETTALPQPSHSLGGVGTISSGTQASANPSASPYLTLDPAAGTSNGVTGVNQLVGSLIDPSNALMSFLCEIQYIPLYLYPR